MIRTIAAAFACLITFQSASADTRDVYTITDIPVDERAASVLEAQQKAFAAARVIGTNRLISRITLPEHRSKAGLILDGQTAQKMALAVDVQEETRGGGRYRGVLATVINPREVRPFLKSQGIPYLDRQAPVALIIPVASGPEIYDWRAVWGERQKTTLAPTVTAIGSYDNSVTWEAIQDELATTRASRGIIADLRPGGSVVLTEITAAGNTPLGGTGSAATLESSVQKVLSKMEDSWKRQAINIDTSSRTLTNANILYTSLPEWNRLRGALARSPLISEFEIRAISRDGAMVRFAYSGDQSQLERDLRQRGIVAERSLSGWTMNSAITGSIQ